MYKPKRSIGVTPIFLKEVSESLYMKLCQIILIWTVVLPWALIICSLCV